MATGLDYSAGPITPPSSIGAAGHSFVIRYVDDPARGLSAKHITPAEYAGLRAAGVTVWLVFEQDTTDITDGAGGGAAGAGNALRAVDGALAIGYPTGSPIFMAVDEHLAADQLPTALAYLRGAWTVLESAGFELGVYGFTELVQAAQAAGVGSVFWQCGHDPGPGAGVHLWQRNDVSPLPVVGGVQCDVNVAYLPIVAAQPANQPASSHVEDTVILLDWPAGAGAHKLVCPVGSASAITAAAWLSLACDGALGHYDVWFQSDTGGISEQHGGLVKDQRVWWPLPDGCTQITVHYAGAAGPVGAAIEIKPK